MKTTNTFTKEYFRKKDLFNIQLKNHPLTHN